MNIVQQNLKVIKGEIIEAAETVGRDSRSIELLAVTKYTTVEAIRLLLEAGHSMIGEIHVQQAISRKEIFGDEIQLHLIGRLQSNKVHKALQIADVVIETIDRLKILDKIIKIADEEKIIPTILLQVDFHPNANKGLQPAKALEFAQRIVKSKRVSLAGIMTIAPMYSDSDKLRSYFAEGRKFLEKDLGPLLGKDPEHLTYSAGMSGDFIEAITEGSTLVRIGRRIFEGF